MAAKLPEMDNVVKSLQSAASVIAFDSTSLATYRAALKQELLEVVVAVSSAAVAFEHVLFAGVPWKDLLIHDSKRRSFSTPLEEVISVLVNPCIVPYAMSSSIAMVFFRVLVEDTANNVSQNRLLHALRRLLEARPSIQVHRWNSFVQAQLCLSVIKVEAYNVARAHRLVSLCKHLSSISTVMIKCLLTLLQSIDDVDIKLLQTKRIKQTVESCSCQKQTRRVANMRSLDDSEHDDGSGLMVKAVHVIGGGTIERISRVANHRHAECDLCRLPHSARAITQLHIQLVLLRSRIYRKVVSVLNALADKDLNRRGLQSVVHFSCQHPESASLRLCTVLLAETMPVCQCVIEYQWTLYERRTSFLGEAVLKSYAELLVESSYFDRPSKYWKALQPLVNHITRLCDAQLSLSATQTSNQESDTQTRHLLRCLSYILCRRRQLLVAIESDPKFREFTLKLSLSFSDADWWTSNDMSQNEKEEILFTLQAFGILGFLSIFTGCDSIESEQRTFPFPKIMGIRAAYRRMGPNVTREALLSNPKVRPGAAALPHKQLHSRPSGPDDRIVGTPIMDHLNDDVLRIVFSFLGYKRLVKASGICKIWKLLTEDDALWFQAYAWRFPIQKQDKTIVYSVTRGDSKFKSWRTLFANKILAERALRFKRNSSGWKHRTCTHIGCLMVLKSPSQMTKHYGTHIMRTPKERKRKLIRAKRKLSSADSCEPPSLKQRLELKSKR
jgi:hypothetical protein